MGRRGVCWMFCNECRSLVCECRMLGLDTGERLELAGIESMMKGGGVPLPVLERRRELLRKSREYRRRGKEK